MEKVFGVPLSSAPEVSAEIQEKLRALNVTTGEELIAMAAVEGCKPLLAKHLGLTAAQLSSHLEAVKKSLPGRTVSAMEEPYRTELGLGSLEPPRELRARPGPYEAAVQVAALPANVNHIHRLRSIQDQAARGTCVGFGCTALNEDYFYLLQGAAPDLSEQCLYQRCKENDGIPNVAGTYVHVGMDCLVNFGQPTEACQPYNPNLPHNQPGPHPPCCAAESPQWKISKKVQLNETSVADLKAALADGKTVVFAIPVYDSWYSSAAVRRTGNITMPLPGESGIGGHAMLFVGYQDDATTPGGGYFILRNSWGTGNFGYQCTYGAGYGTLPFQYMTNHGWEAYTYEKPTVIPCPPAPIIQRCPPRPVCAVRPFAPCPVRPVVCRLRPYETPCPVRPIICAVRPMICVVRPYEPYCPPGPYEPACPVRPLICAPRPYEPMCPPGPFEPMCPPGPGQPWFQDPRGAAQYYPEAYYGAGYYPQGWYSPPEYYGAPGYPAYTPYYPGWYDPAGYYAAAYGTPWASYWGYDPGCGTDPTWFQPGTFSPTVKEKT